MLHGSRPTFRARIAPRRLRTAFRRVYRGASLLRGRAVPKQIVSTMQGSCEIASRRVGGARRRGLAAGSRRRCRGRRINRDFHQAGGRRRPAVSAGADASLAVTVLRAAARRRGNAEAGTLRRDDRAGKPEAGGRERAAGFGMTSAIAPCYLREAPPQRAASASPRTRPRVRAEADRRLRATGQSDVKQRDGRPIGNVPRGVLDAPHGDAIARFRRKTPPRTTRAAHAKTESPPAQASSGVTSGSPAKCRVAFSMNSVTVRSRACGEVPARCGVSTTCSSPINSAGGAGSPS